MNNNSNSLFRVIFESREQYRLMDENFNIYAATIKGSLRYNFSDLPTVGDWVNGSHQSGDWVLIENIVERKSVLARSDSGKLGQQILATNVDVLFIVTSANQDFNLNRLDRYILMAQAGGVTPVIVVNKIELAKNPQLYIDEVAARFPQIHIFGVSVYENCNLELLVSCAQPGKTVAFVGSSGVGKSSLTNYLLGQQLAITGDIRESDSRGRHTTTHRELHVAPNGAVVIDTPGLRSVGLSEDASLDSIFSEITRLEQNCKFSDCQHQSEPGCAINKALDSGDLEIDRWSSYLKLQKEIAFEKRKVDKSLASAQKKLWAKHSQNLRSKYKANR